MFNPSEKGILQAIEKFSTFIKVNHHKPANDRLEAVDNWAEGVGVDGKKWDTLTTSMAKLVDSPGGELGWAIVGVIIGLYIADYEWEQDESKQ